jgi:hypothetical protein
MNIRIAKWIAFTLLLALILALFALGLGDLRSPGEKTEVADYEPWTEEVVEEAASLPVQEGGRVKPLETRANFAMLQMRGDRKMEITNGKEAKAPTTLIARIREVFSRAKEGEVTITPTAWMLDLLFRPELAHQLPTFRIDDSRILKSVGMDTTDHERRDRYSFNELEPVFGDLMQKAGDFQKLRDQGTELEPQESQTVELATVLRNYFYLTHYFDFVRDGVELRREGTPGKKVQMSTVMAMAPEIVRAVRQGGRDGTIPSPINELLGQIEKNAANSKFNFHPLPPYEASEDKWASVGELIEGTLTGQVSDPVAAIKDVQRLEGLHEAYREGDGAFLAALKDFRKAMMARAGDDAEAMEAFTGQRENDASAVAAYFAPLNTWLTAQNRGKDCGWEV